MLQLFSDASTIKCALSLATFATDPFEAVVRQKLSHLLYLLLVVITLNGELRDLIDTIIAGSHRQLLVLIFQVRNFSIFLC